MTVHEYLKVREHTRFLCVLSDWKSSLSQSGINVHKSYSIGTMSAPFIGSLCPMLHAVVLLCTSLLQGTGHEAEGYSHRGRHGGHL